jgi:hypothetical protein
MLMIIITIVAVPSIIHLCFASCSIPDSSKVNLFRFTDQVLRRPIVAYRGLKFNRPPAYDFKRVSRPSLAGKSCSHNWLSTPRKPIIPNFQRYSFISPVVDGH